MCRGLSVGTDVFDFWNLLLLLLPLPCPDSNLLHSPKSLRFFFHDAILDQPDKEQLLGTRGEAGDEDRNHSRERGFESFALSGGHREVAPALALGKS